MNNSVIGLDIAKNIFHMYTLIEGKAVKKKLKRGVLKRNEIKGSANLKY